MSEENLNYTGGPDLGTFSHRRGRKGKKKKDSRAGWLIYVGGVLLLVALHFLFYYLPDENVNSKSLQILFLTLKVLTIFVNPIFLSIICYGALAFANLDEISAWLVGIPTIVTYLFFLLYFMNTFNSDFIQQSLILSTESEGFFGFITWLTIGGIRCLLLFLIPIIPIKGFLLLSEDLILFGSFDFSFFDSKPKVFSVVIIYILIFLLLMAIVFPEFFLSKMVWMYIRIF